MYGNRSLTGETSQNATSITGYPIQTSPPPINGQVMVYENGNIDWITQVPGDIDSITNIGSGAGTYAGLSGSTAQFYSLTSANSNITVGVNSPLNVVDVNLNNTISVTNITTTDLSVTGSISSPLIITGPPAGVTELLINANDATGSTAGLSIGRTSGNEGYFEQYDPATGNLNILPFGGTPIGGNVAITAPNHFILNAGNVDINDVNSTFNTIIVAEAEIAVDSAILDGSGQPGVSGQFLSSNGFGVLWEYPHDQSIYLTTIPSALQNNKRYICDIGSVATLNLPTASANGDEITVCNINSNAVRIQPQSGQIIFTNNNSTGGYITNIPNKFEHGSITLIYQFVSPNSYWVVKSANGPWSTGSGDYIGSPVLAGLADTIITSPTANQILQYNGSNWINSTYTLPTTVVTTTPVNLLVNNKYVISVTTAVANLPATAATGDEITVCLNALSSVTITLTGGYMIETNNGDELVSISNIVGKFENMSITFLFGQVGTSGYWFAKSTNGPWIGSAGGYIGSGSLPGLNGVSITSPSAGDLLKYNGSVWQNAAGSGFTTIYDGDSSLSGNRTVNQAGHDLNFTGGGVFQINNPSITGQANGDQALAIVADGNGVLAAYALGYNWASVNFFVDDLQNMTTMNNCVNLYETFAVGSSAVIMDVYLSFPASFETSTAHWIVQSSYSDTNTGWATIPMNQGLFAYGSAYILQGRCNPTGSNGNQFQLRIVQTINNGHAPGAGGNITILRREQGNQVMSYDLMDTTPYHELAINYEIGLQNQYRAKAFNWSGQDITTMGTQTFYYMPGMTLWLSATVVFSLTTVSSNVVALQFQINGNLMGFALGNTYAGSVSNTTLTCASVDLQPGTLIQAGFLGNGNNTITVSLVNSGGTLTTSGNWYCISLTQHF